MCVCVCVCVCMHVQKVQGNINHAFFAFQGWSI